VPAPFFRKKNVIAMFCVISSLSPESAWQSHSPVIAGEARQSYKKEI